MTSMTVECIFCQAKVGTSPGSLRKLERHMREGHDLHFNQHLSSALNFLSEPETESLVKMLQDRMDLFKAEGILEFQENIFTKHNVTDEVQVDSSAAEEKRQDDKLDDVAAAREEITELDQGFEKEAKESDDQIPDGIKLKKVRVELTKIKYREDFNEEIKGQVDEKKETIKMVGCVKKRRRHLEKLSPNPTSLISSEKYNHINLVESFSSKGYCRLCYESCGDERGLAKHETEQHSDETDSLARTSFTLLDLIFKCDLCPQIPGFLTENLRNSHLDKDHRSRSVQRVVCQVCKGSFLPSTLKAHLRSHRSDCNLCFKTFRTMKDLRAHQIRKHHREVKFVTDDLQRSEETENPRNTCKLCYAEYSNQWNLQRHQVCHKEDSAAFQREISEEELAFPCTDCDLRFLSEHIRSFHHKKVHKTLGPTTEVSPDGGGDGGDGVGKSYRKFCSLSRYKRHKKVHREDLRSLNPSDCAHLCSVCELRFLSPRLLSQHLAREHFESVSFATSN